MPPDTRDAPPSTPANRHARPRHTAVVAVIVAAAVVGVAATVVDWASRQALDTEAWTDTSSALLKDDAIRTALSSYLADALFTSVDVKSELQASLPPDAQGWAVPATAGMRAIGEWAALNALSWPVVQRLWEEANRVAHQTLVASLRNDSEVLATTGGVVTLDLTPLVEQVGTQLGLDVQGMVPADVSRIEILRSEQLRSAQLVARSLRFWGIALPIATLLLFVLAVGMARGWRRDALEDVAVALIAVGAIVLVARSVVGAWVVGSVAATPAAEPVARSVWRVGTSLLASSAIGLVAYGSVLLFGAWLAGPARTARRIRNRIAPVLRERRWAYAALAVILFLIFWWSPTPATQRLAPSLVLIALAIGGLEALRWVSLREARAGPTERPGGTTPEGTRREAA